MALTFGSLFAGIGGFDLGFQRSGMRCAWQVEKNKAASIVLARHWPSVPRFGDIRDVLAELPPADVICGGDPCPCRSRARGNRPSKHPDLSGYFLAVVGKLRPRWVVRENVPAPDAIDFAVCLDLLGYRTSAIALDARDFTGQSRRRQFLCGCLGHDAAERFERAVSDAASGFGFVASSGKEETPIAACIAAHPQRLAAEDTYCYENGIGLRRLSIEECERLQGFSGDWTTGLSESARRRCVGNAVAPQVAEWIGRRLIVADA